MVAAAVSDSHSAAHGRSRNSLQEMVLTVPAKDVFEAAEAAEVDDPIIAAPYTPHS